MKRDELFPSRFLRAADLQGRPQVVTIDRVDLEDVGDDASKPVIHFRGRTKGLVCNATNFDATADMHGDETNGWAGKTIEVFPTRVLFKGKMTDAIRIRPPTRPSAQSAQPDRPSPPIEAYANDMDDEIPF